MDKKKDKNIRVDPDVYEIISKIAKKEDRKIKSVVSMIVYDYWEKI